MKIPIPRSYDRVMDWLAVHLLPPDKPTGLRLFSHQITWLEVALAGYTLGLGIFMSLLMGNWLWLPGTILSMALMGIWMMWTEDREHDDKRRRGIDKGDR